MARDICVDEELLASFAEKIRSAGLTLACAESLTGGALSSAIVKIPGASRYFRGGVVSYAVDVKAHVLGVSEKRLAEYGPVDGAVACEMARGAAHICGASLGLATTGVAGPGSNDGHSAGSVWVAVWSDTFEKAIYCHFTGDRLDVREAACVAAVELGKRVCDFQLLFS